VPSLTLTIPGSVGERLQSALPQAEQKHFGQPWSPGTHSRTSSGPATIRNDPAATRAWAEAAVPERRWQRVQWQYEAETGGASIS
jgi:hypothetical protein